MRAIAATLALLLAACAPTPVEAEPPHVETTPATVAERVAAATEEVQATVAGAITPLLGDVRDTVDATVPAPAAQVPTPPVSPAAVAHIIRWEVSSPAYYTRALQRPIWPGGASGVTWGIGYDGGHQSRSVILADWHAHPQATRLAESSGITGNAARDALARFRDILTPFDHAAEVFANASLPAYHRSTLRAYGDGLLQLPPDAQGALVGNTYNRGASMVGSRNTEKRAIRDECIPARDLACIAAQLRAQCRLWRGTSLEAGLCGRREDEARLVEGSA